MRATIQGGQAAADAALAAFDVTGYAASRNEVWPTARRGASRLSPYIRHGLLQLEQVSQATAAGPSYDVKKFHDELLWQEFARHWYAHHGRATRQDTRRSMATSANPAATWDRSMVCLDTVLTELHESGWLVNQTRMWLASHWAIREQGEWQVGEDAFFRHLLDGSRAANRLGWQWTSGVGASKHYGFSRWQVNKRAPGLCDSCDYSDACPIEDWPADPPFVAIEGPATKVMPTEARHGPTACRSTDSPEMVWITAESLGMADPAMAANPELPVVFVWDEPLLAKLNLSEKRLAFLAETLDEIGQSRELVVKRGSPVELLRGTKLAVTFAPVPGFRSIAAAIEPVEVHPWPWLRTPQPGSVSSFSSWRKSHLQ